jgi:hypothetical protein
MPAPQLKALADKAGKSLADAERYYDESKKQVMKDTGKSADALEDDDYQKILGIVKKRLGLKVKPVESIDEAVEAILNGKDIREAIDELVGD